MPSRTRQQPPHSLNPNTFPNAPGDMPGSQTSRAYVDDAYLTQTNRATGTVNNLPATTSTQPPATNNGGGTPGTAGKDGTAATVTVGTTMTLPAGSTAYVTNSGTTSAAILNFGLVMGNNAPNPNFTVSASAVAYNVAPTATLTGTYPNLSIAYTIPAGAPGQGVPTGGTTGQVLTKTSGSDYATAWTDPSQFPVLYLVASSGTMSTMSGGTFTPAAMTSGTNTTSAPAAATTTATGSAYAWDGKAHLRLDTAAGTWTITLPDGTLLPSGVGKRIQAKNINGTNNTTYIPFTGSGTTQYVRNSTSKSSSMTQYTGDALDFEWDGIDTWDVV